MKWKQSGADMAALWKKYRLVIFVILAGVLLMLLPSGERAGKETTPAAPAGQESFSLEATCREMEEILGRIEGAGRLQLMLTLKSGSQLELAEDSDRSEAERESRSDRSTVTINRGGGAEDIVVTRQTYPVYRGAVIACEGADDAAVRLALTEAVCALTGLSSDRVSIVKWSA